MTTQRYSVRPLSTPADDDRLRWVEKVSRLLDSQFSVPGTTWRFGLDPIMGLIPVVGGIPSLAISGILILTMMRHGASGAVVVRMLLNVLLDTIIGAIPIVGTIFDFTYKANDRNVRLLRAHYAEGKYQGSGKGLLITALLGMLLVFGLLIWGLWSAGVWLWQYFQ